LLFAFRYTVFHTFREPTEMSFLHADVFESLLDGLLAVDRHFVNKENRCVCTQTGTGFDAVITRQAMYVNFIFMVPWTVNLY
jgi:hypothetical protein